MNRRTSIHLDWKAYSTPPMRAVTGYLATGERHHFMVSAFGHGRYLLFRWGKGTMTHLEDIRQAAATATEVDGFEEGRHLAAQFEAGENLPGRPAWTRPVVRNDGGDIPARPGS